MSIPASDKRTDLVTLGAADLFFDGVDVGHVKGSVTIECAREYVNFKPANELGVVKNFRIREAYRVRCSSAEMKLSNIKLALGVTTSVTASSTPSGYSSSLSFTVEAADNWDSLTFGGSKTLDDFPLKVEHTRPNGKKVIVILYKAQCISEFNFAFNEEDITMYDLVFDGLTDSSRSDGDKVGIILDEI